MYATSTTATTAAVSPPPSPSQCSVVSQQPSFHFTLPSNNKENISKKNKNNNERDNNDNENENSNNVNSNDNNIKDNNSAKENNATYNNNNNYSNNNNINNNNDNNNNEESTYEYDDMFVSITDNDIDLDLNAPLPDTCEIPTDFPSNSNIEEEEEPCVISSTIIHNDVDVATITSTNNNAEFVEPPYIHIDTDSPTEDQTVAMATEQGPTGQGSGVLTSEVESKSRRKGKARQRWKPLEEVIVNKYSML